MVIAGIEDNGMIACPMHHKFIAATQASSNSVNLTGSKTVVPKHWTPLSTLVFIGIPEAANAAAKKQVLTHDSQQWKFIEDQMGLKNCVVVDTFRIPKSPK